MFGWPWIRIAREPRDTRLDAIVDRLKVMLKSKDQARTRDLIRMLIADIGRMA